MVKEQIFWFRTQQSLLEEWGYIRGVWHLVRRTPLSMTQLSLTREGEARVTATGELIPLPSSRVVLSIVDATACEQIGPIDHPCSVLGPSRDRAASRTSYAVQTPRCL